MLLFSFGTVVFTVLFNHILNLLFMDTFYLKRKERLMINVKNEVLKIDDQEQLYRRN